jgi:spermidine synthase
MIEQVNIPAGISGDAKIIIDSPDLLSRLCGARDGQSLNKPKYTRLIVNDECMMTDAEFEIRTNSEVVFQAKGSVLVAGLGIGLILSSILKKELVSSVVVVEKSKDVIKLVASHYCSNKLRVLNKDVFRYEPVKGTKFDTIYFDIWPNICRDYYEEIKTLKVKFRKYLAKGGWMHAWCEERMKGF